MVSGWDTAAGSSFFSVDGQEKRGGSPLGKLRFFFYIHQVKNGVEGRKGVKK